jgi:hypothetical protein
VAVARTRQVPQAETTAVARLAGSQLPEGKAWATTSGYVLYFSSIRLVQEEYEADDGLLVLSISRREEMLAVIKAKPAHDIEGLKAKASVMLAYAKVFPPGDDLDRELATSLAQDLVLAA